MSATRIYNQICALRLNASMLYDMGRMQGHTPEQCAESIRPLSEQLSTLIAQAIQHDLPGTVLAIKALETEAQKHEKDAEFLMEKARATRAHANTIKDALKADLKKNNSNSRVHEGYSITLVGEELTIR